MNNQMLNIMSQLSKMTNPMQSLMGILNPQQKQILNNFQGKTDNEKATYIANWCNQNGISKAQLSEIINKLR